jgi:hypothetical protein
VHHLCQLLTPVPPSSLFHEPSPGRSRTLSAPTSPEGAAYPIPMRLAPSSAPDQSVGVLRIGWVPRAGPQTSYIPVPPPQDLSQPMPLARSSCSHESDNYPRQAMFAAEHSSYALVRTRNFAYTNLPHFRSQDRVPCLFYPSLRRHICLSMSSSVPLPQGDLPARCATIYRPCTRGARVNLNDVRHRAADTVTREVTGRS